MKPVKPRILQYFIKLPKFRSGKLYLLCANDKSAVPMHGCWSNAIPEETSYNLDQPMYPDPYLMLKIKRVIFLGEAVLSPSQAPLMKKNNISHARFETLLGFFGFGIQLSPMSMAVCTVWVSCDVVSHIIRHLRHMKERRKTIRQQYNETNRALLDSAMWWWNHTGCTGHTAGNLICGKWNRLFLVGKCVRSDHVVVTTSQPLLYVSAPTRAIRLHKSGHSQEYI